MFARILGGFRSLPLPFRVLVAATFVYRIGGTMLSPFFALYITRHFNVGMTEAGLLLAVFGATGLLGSFVGGAATDRLGRRSILIFGLVADGLGTLSLGLMNTLPAFYAMAAVVGFLGSVAGPAQSAMVADILPEERRSQGYGVLRVVANLAWIAGPSLGGLVAGSSYVYLFAIYAVGSMIAALIVFRLIAETHPQPTGGEAHESVGQTLAGYRLVARDRLYLAFLAASVLMGMVYQQMYSTLSVYLHNVHNLPDSNYGFLLSIDAFAVVLFQFWIAGKTSKRPPMLMMSLGTALYMIGFSMYGFVSGYPMFVLAILVITLGEMIVMPVSQALAARFAPAEMRGRYMAFFDLSWSLPSMVGPTAAGLILDNASNPNWVWYLCGIIAACSAVGFYWLHYSTQTRFATTQEPTPA